MSDITREQFAQAVAAAVSSVYHLYRQVDRLVEELRSGLGDVPEPLTPLSGTLGKLSGRSSARMMVRNEYGILFQPASALDEDAEDEGDEPEEADEDETAAGRKSGPAAIQAEQSLLALRIAIYDPQKPDAAEPRIEYGVLGDWRVGGVKPDRGEPLQVARYMLRRIPRAVAMGISGKNALVDTGALAKTALGKKKGDERRLSCRVFALGDRKPLYEMDNPGSVEALVGQMKELWRSSAKDQS